MADRLGVALDDGREWELDLLARLVAVPSVTGRPTEIMAVLEPELTALGLHVSRIEVDPGGHGVHPDFSPPYADEGPRPPVLHGVDPTAPERPELLLFAHTDTEPVHPGWSADPFTLRRGGPRAYGLGASDDKAGVVTILGAVRAIHAAGRTTAWRPRIVLGAGKQGGSLGMRQGVEAAAGVRAAVYSHPAESGAGLAQLKVASRGLATLRVEVPGQTPQPIEVRTPASADPRRGHNAAARAARLAVAAQRWSHDAEVWAVVGLESGVAAHEVPASARLDLACWFTGGTVADIVAAAEERLRAAAVDDWERRHPPVVTVHGVRANPASCADSTFARAALATVAGVTGRPAEPYGWHSASDIRFPIRLLGAPAVGFGALAGGFYGPQEWVDVPSMRAATETLARILLAGPVGDCP